MKIVFYSTNSNTFNPQTFLYETLPSNQYFFDDFIKKHPDDEFFCVSQLPAMFMPENSTIILDNKLDALEFADYILTLNADIAIAMTFWVAPFDWLSINDCLVAQKLELNGIKTICHPLESNLICFDKWKTHQFLLQHGFQVPDTIFVDHDLYFCAGSHKEVIHNVYKNSIKNQLAQLSLPLIIKDTVGLSSYGMTVVHSYGEAICYLNSKRNNSNRIIQNYIQGEQFGVEIYGCPGNYHILPLFQFTLNQYGISSPKLSEKKGAFQVEKDLHEMLISLAEKMRFCGIAQIDLIFSDNKWYIIEINPRLNGMTYTNCAYLGKSVFELLYDFCIMPLKSKLINQNDDIFQSVQILEHSNVTDFESKKLLNIKLPIFSSKKLAELKKIDGVKILNQTNNKEAKQEREKGFCECIIVDENEIKLAKTFDKIKTFCENDITE